MRHLAPATLAATFALSLLGCASPTGRPGIIATERAELQSQCAARGGYLRPSGAATGRPALDEFCEIRGPSAPPR